MNLRAVFRRLLVGSLLAASLGSPLCAQYELRSVAFNPLFQATDGPAKAPVTDPLVPAPSQFASVKATGGAAGPLGLDYQKPPGPLRREYGPRALPNDAAAWSDTQAGLAVTSSAPGATLQSGDIVTLTGASGYRETRSYNGTTWVIGNVVRYAAAVYSPATATSEGSAVVLVSAVLGAALRPESPRYLFGDVIARPAKTFDGTKDATGDLAEYWLSKPVLPGTSFDLGDGTTHTQPGTKGSEPYYFSIHANAVFASQAGRVSITWRSRETEPVTNEAGATVQRYRLKTEEFFVSTASLRPARTIFWTQKAFNGPVVNIPLGSIEVVRPIYNAAMPAEVKGTTLAADGVTVTRDSEEYLPEGGRREQPVELRTLWFDNSTGQQATLRAYNRTGRLMVEYLGPGQVQPIETGARVFLGADVVDVVQQAPQIDAVVELGERITPRDKGNFEIANSAAWLGSPLQSGQTGGAGYYNMVTRADGAKIFYAEKENLSPANVVFYWLERSPPALTAGAAAALANITLEWPKQKNGYRLIWPDVDPANPTPGLARYAHNTVATDGSPAGTGVQFAAGQLPFLAFQDDPDNKQAVVNTATQRFTVSFSNDGLNRTLLRFGSGSEVWYVRVFTQAEDRVGFLEGDGTAAVRANGSPNAFVGTRLERPSDAYLSAGYIAHGRGYSDKAYIDPFLAGADAASRGAIIPVNAIPGEKDLVVWWFKVVTPPAGSSFQPFYVPAKMGRYTIRYPDNAPKIVLAADGQKTGGVLPGGALDTAQERAGKLYVQNTRADLGFNPNEEHALLSSGDSRVFALRDDINDTSSDATKYTSEPFVLWSYTDAGGRPAMKVFQVVRETAIDRFSYEVRVPSLVRGPMPLGVLEIPTDETGASKNFESTPLDIIHEQPSSAATKAAYDRYNRFTWEDRNRQHHVYRGPHNDSTSAQAMTMQFYYPMRADFYLPPEAGTVAVGTALPYLRAKKTDGSGYVGTITAGPPLNITFLPKWNPADPDLELIDTLTVAKEGGLPAVYGQSSAEVLYQRSVAQGGPGKPSVVLYDPLREKEFFLGGTGQLQEVPKSALTTEYQGKTYFQGLPPHIQKRFFFDSLRGPVGAVKGALVLKGQLVTDEGYLHLNLLTPEEETSLKALVPAKDSSGATLPEKALWDAAITGLATKVETFVKNPDIPGKYKAGPSVTVDARTVAEVKDPDRVSSPTYAAATASETAVVNYALTATGQGDGWVTMVFGNSRNPDQTPAGNPVSVKTFRVRPRLARGDVKVLKSDNPLDEKVTLRHTGAFMAAPTATELPYEFQWRWISATSTVGHDVYSVSASSLLGTDFKQVINPAAALPTLAEYTSGQSVGSAPSIGGTAVGERPIAVLKSVSGVDFSAGVPDHLIFSGDFSEKVGFTLYVEGQAVLTSNRLTATDSTAKQKGLISQGLPQQYSLPGRVFQRKVNVVEIALYAAEGANGTVSAAPVQFQLHALVDKVSGVWNEATAAADKPALGHIITVGGEPSAPLGNPLLMLGDNYFTVRYRPKATTTTSVAPRRAVVANDPDPNPYAWSRWAEAQQVEGWIKRVLAQVNPFNQRVKDLANNAVNTDVSMLTQAGKRWEGDVPLALEEINNVGLVEFYETILNRAKVFSIDAATNNADANKALLLAAGYLSDLYTLLGNEAYADAANSTISIDDATTATEVNTSRFAFEGQVASVLDEELALLRGRDNLNSNPGVQKAPAYNRLYWNYTGGINAGQAIYALNYNIREKAGSSTADGRVDEKDAQRMFPQGHGDAYGHYLTALTGYYRLLTNPNFTWVPTSEQLKVLGQDVEVDYQDERKFARAAANVASAAQQIVALTHRQSYKDGATGWQQFEVDAVNANRHWGLDDWVSRATQGAYYHWMVGNAMLPDKDTDPDHTGVQIIDRTTVPELASLTTLATSFQTTIDGANARLNPLGLSPGAIAFDISPTELKAGRSHYEQINDRALRAVLNAKGAFDQAAKMTRLLRNQENQTDDANTGLVDQEAAFRKQLIELYGTPYTGEIGAGRTYVQGYTGPDTQNWFVIDRPTGLVDTETPISVTLRVGLNIQEPTVFTDLSKAYQEAPFTAAALGAGAIQQTVEKSFLIQPNASVQYADTYLKAIAAPGRRAVVGKLQQALLDAHQARVALMATVDDLGDAVADFARRQKLYGQMLDMQSQTLLTMQGANDKLSNLDKERANLNVAADFLALGGEFTRALADAFAEGFPKVVGLSYDPFSSARATAVTVAALASYIGDLSAVGMRAKAQLLEVDMASKQADADYAVTRLGFNYDQAQAVYEYEFVLRSLVSSHYKLEQLATDLQRKNERVRTLLAEGKQLQLDKELYRQRAAAKVQGFRTRDFTFRTFRNEALEQYRTLFDLASRYTYLAAKAYDYETGLLGSQAGQGVISGIVAARSLGDLTGGMPQATVSTLGDSGLAGTMARLQADWSVAKGRLGINNPDQNGTLFSLRREHFRIGDNPASDTNTQDWKTELQRAWKSDLLAEPGVAAVCRNLANGNLPDGTPKPVPGFLFRFSTTIRHGFNFFGREIDGPDHAFSASNFATKIYSVGVSFRGYEGMDPYRPGATTPTFASTSANVLSATPYAYLVPVGSDYMLAPPLGDQATERIWKVSDQALPLPFNLGASSFSTAQFYTATSSLTESPAIMRTHQAFRPVSDPNFFYSTIPAEFTTSRLVGRSVWNDDWILVIPAYMLHSNEQTAGDRFTNTVTDIQLFLRTYSHSGN